MTVSGGYAITRTILIWVACAVTRAMETSRLELLLRAMSGSMALQQLGFLMISMARVSTEGHKNHMSGNPRAVLSQHHP